MAQLSFGGGRSWISAPIVTNNQQPGAGGSQQSAVGSRLIDQNNADGLLHSIDRTRKHAESSTWDTELSTGSPLILPAYQQPKPTATGNLEGATTMLKLTIPYARYILSTLATVGFGFALGN
jgi:hypothetical protein